MLRRITSAPSRRGLLQGLLDPNARVDPESHDFRLGMAESWLTEGASPPDTAVYPKTPEEMAGNRELVEGLTRAIGALPEYHRTVILLREVDGLSYDEIAQVLGCSVGTVMSRLHYARAKLREALSEHREG